MPKTIIMNVEGWPGIELAKDMLNSSMPPLDIVEKSIKLTEAESQVRTVGFGGAPNALGEMELDASIMNGDTLQAGTIGALKATMHPISVARKLMERLPFVMLVGEGAKRFASEVGFKEENILSDQAKKDYEAWKLINQSEQVVDLFDPTSGKGSHGTVICLTRNENGSFAGGVSTSGWDYKYPGRLGDSPIIGAGLYVDSEYGAAACTHCGENAIRTSLARSVVLYMKCGMAIKEAVAEGMKDLARLKGGHQGQVVIYALDKDGNFFAARRYEQGPACEFLVFTDGMDAPEKRQAEFIG